MRTRSSYRDNAPDEATQSLRDVQNVLPACNENISSNKSKLSGILRIRGNHNSSHSTPSPDTKRVDIRTTPDYASKSNKVRFAENFQYLVYDATPPPPTRRRYILQEPQEQVTELETLKSRPALETLKSRPHLRQNCSLYEFDPSALSRLGNEFGIYTNAKYCENCYCYVCDAFAKDCNHWSRTDLKANEDNHCCAVSMHTSWKCLRHGFRYSLFRSLQPVSKSYSLPIFADGPGPFDPSDELASNDLTLTPCRKCGWYNRFSHRNFFYPKHRIGVLDLCHQCGRVASELDFGKVQSIPHQPGPTDIFLGEKSIPFSINAHDPRMMDTFKYNWEASTDWTLNEGDMEEDAFRHRFGKHPTPESIIAHIPEAGIPMSTQDTITLANPTDSHLAMLLYRVTDKIVVGEAALQYSITGNWNKKSRIGVSSWKRAAVNM
jgi:hypothetical protein